ncbi:MAG: CoA transferase [Alphaproteobacteria bacterium]|nr:CoA transferase [Alphaproteobacteria bacterium]MBU0798185.1 CoA transferase [Alphaproteobacteria bacterium]MBU0887597.1 CoA transferase [Alphaproteobacteria bacterium]MBU1814248.1 CoA transferase [Alphaproteobacteria bacterium]
MQNQAPLSHIRVLDLSRVLAGPWATQFLADMGAYVIKVERPGEGDDTRGWGPPYLVEPGADGPGLSAYFLACNRGKRSIEVDMATPEGQEIIRRLAAECDVVVENYKVGGLARYGLDYASLKPVNPKLIWCSITGFGQTGPYAKRAGYDFLIQAMSGLMSVTGKPDGEPGAEPMKVGVAISDQICGLYSLSAILTALIKRDRTGEGEQIDMALLDTQIATMANQATNYLVSGVAPTRMGNAHPNVVPYQVFPTADGHMILGIGNDGQFARFCAVVGAEHLSGDPLYRTNAARIVNRETLIPQIAAIVLTRGTNDWIGLLENHAVPCGPINDLAQVFADPQVAARGLKRVLHSPAAAQVPQVGNPVKFASGPTTSDRAPALLGADTAEVLRDVLGMDEAEIAELRRR